MRFTALAASALVALVALAALAAPAGAIENRTFGMARGGEARPTFELRAGERATAEAVMWNNTDAPLELALSLQPATLSEGGQPQLGGDPAATDDVTLRTTRVELAPGARRTVPIVIEADDRITGEERTVVIVAQPRAETGAAPAVLERLALVAFLQPDPSQLKAPGGGADAMIVALAVALLALAAAGLAVQRSRSRSGQARLVVAAAPNHP